ncbi:MAG: ACT domain-containing protein [Elusimicrobiales bacterium]|nr:ACT domain-containing protein [Elusimicrobiales bacterium]
MIKMVKQYTVFLPNKPGALHSFIELFAKEGVNIIGISSEIHDESGIIKIAVDSDRKLSYILTREGFTTLETTMISIILPDKPGELIKLTKLLAEHSINITTIYGTAAGTPSRILLNVSDLEKTLSLLKEFYEKQI